MKAFRALFKFFKYMFITAFAIGFIGYSFLFIMTLVVVGDIKAPQETSSAPIRKVEKEAGVVTELEINTDSVEVSEARPKKASVVEEERSSRENLAKLPRIINEMIFVESVVGDMLKERDLTVYCENICNQTQISNYDEFLQMIGNDFEGVLSDPKGLGSVIQLSMTAKIVPPNILKVLHSIGSKSDRGVLDNIAATAQLHAEIFKIGSHFKHFVGLGKSFFTDLEKSLDGYKKTVKDCSESKIGQDEAIASCRSTIAKTQSLFKKF